MGGDRIDRIMSRDLTRIELTDEILQDFIENVYEGDISQVSMERGLPYSLIYNMVHGRIHSISAENYRILFGQEPPLETQRRVDGTYFRGMVRLWLFLNEDSTEKKLYEEFYPSKRIRKVDYRIFSGMTKSVEKGLERLMEEKFLSQGFSRQDISEWIDDLDQNRIKERVPYDDIKPLLDYLEETLQVNPTRVLNQWYLRYESGELKSVSGEIFKHALRLKEKTKKVINSGSTHEVEKLREEIYGKREGVVFFTEIEEELDFIKKQTGRSPKRYLGRSIGHYRKSRLKRVASWRAEKIKKDCRELIRKDGQLKLDVLPKSIKREIYDQILHLVRSHVIQKLLEDEDHSFELQVLRPVATSREEYHKEVHGFTPMERAHTVLGMSKRAFDKMVATHSDIFRRLGRYQGRWYVPSLYLKEIMEKRGFDLIKDKYEFLAREGRPRRHDEGRSEDIHRGTGEMVLRYMKGATKAGLSLSPMAHISIGYPLLCSGEIAFRPSA
jgi:hypothetical protein